MQYVGDAVMAVFGAPFPQDDHADQALAGRVRDARTPGKRSTTTWRADGLPEFGLGIGLSTGEVAAALLGSDERLEYTRRRRHGEPRAAAAGPGAAAGHGAVGRDASMRCRSAPAVEPLDATVREGTGDAGASRTG